MDSNKPLPTPHDWGAGRRLRAWVLHEQGWKQRAIAAALGVTEGAVSQWLARARAEGVAALRQRRSPGAPPKLPRAQLAALPALLARGAPAFGFRGDVWTSPRIATVIKTHFGVRYSTRHVRRLLQYLHWTPQRPVPRATQRDEDVIEQWSTERWPALKKGRSKKAAPSSG